MYVLFPGMKASGGTIVSFTYNKRYGPSRGLVDWTRLNETGQVVYQVFGFIATDEHAKKIVVRIFD